MVLEFLKIEHLFTEKELLWPLIVAGSDVHHQVKQMSSAALKRRLSADRMADPATVQMLCSLFLEVRVNAWPRVREELMLYVHLCVHVCMCVSVH